MGKNYTIGLVGNPNCGKTTLFNALTGSRQRVGNWPGVTVERKSGDYRLGDATVEVVDLPGTYSLDVVDRDISLDERVARDYVQEGEADLIINIVDASNLERNLYLTTQLVEMGVPLLVVLNMVDVAESKNMKVSAAELAAQLGCPVLPVIASTGKGVPELKAAIGKAVEAHPRPTARISYSDALTRAIEQLAASIESAMPTAKVSPRWLAVRLLEGDDLARQAVGETLAQQAKQEAKQFGDDLDILVADARYSLANRVANASVRISGQVARDVTDRIDRVVLNRVLGIPIFLVMMY
ncbi:MAG: 50S ribosome-binding GTPase, partial [Propionivibrio sp.]|nr:50S ribosome-binding GTPase [Propionivibrio sp.]